MKIIKPTGILSEYISYYWVLEIDSSEGEVCERIIPTGDIQLMFHYRNTFVCKNPGNLLIQPRSLISGISSGFADVATRGSSGVIAVVFYPCGACNFFDFPLRDIDNDTVDLNDILNNETRFAEERICSARSLNERIKVLEEFLLSRFNPVWNNDIRLVMKGACLISQSMGRISASDLSDELMVSGKTLERKFSAYLGKNPKQYIRIVRFKEAVRSLAKPHVNLTELAYENGYFDQAHFINDFKSMSGYTPGEFLNIYPCRTDFFD